jgi:hypothetical protein
MDSLGPAGLKLKQSAVTRTLPEFDRDSQVRRVTAWITDLLNERYGHEFG